ncbi:MAG: magnesium transporter [Bacteroidota bacterium]|jgi:magnesium transporter
MYIKITKELLADIRRSIVEGRDTALIQLTQDLHPADLAEIINELREEEAVYLYRSIDEERGAEVMLELDEDVRNQLLSKLTSREIAEDLIENFDSDDAADVIAELPEEKQEEVIALLEDVETASDIIDLMNYAEGTAGALMAKELIKVNASWSVAMAIREMRKQSEDIDNIYTIYVVDDEDHIMGTLSMKTLIFASASLRSTIKELYQDYKIHSVKSDTPAEEVVNVMKKYDLVVVPVVNEDKQLIGRITIDDVVDVMQEEADKDYQLASGISEDVESGDSIRTLTRARLPWLLIGMGGGMSSAYIIGLYDITENPQMAIFMPLIAATGGNVGVQSAALVVKALANQSVLDETVWRKLLKELGVGSFNGLICSLLIFFTTQLFHFDLSMSITASIALFSVIVFASISGTYIPLTLNRFGIDPALATGPFITTTNDIIGLIIYFGVGKLLHSFLLTMPLNIFH